MTDERLGKSSASRLHLVVRCPGFLPLWDSIKGDGKGEAESRSDADFGKAVHAAWAGDIEEKSLAERQLLVKKKADEIECHLVSDIFAGEPIKASMSEVRFYLTDPKTGEVVHSARIDKAHTDGKGKWLLMDLKSLYGDQDPPDLNWQLLGEAVCIADDDKTRNEDGELPINEVIACIVQPLKTLTPELVRYSFDDLRRAKRLILQKIDESETPGAPRIPGAHCKFCPCSAVCDVSVSDLIVSERRTNLGLDHLTPQLVASIIPNVSSLKRRISEFEERAKKLAAEGLLPGYEMRTQDGNRYIQSQESVQAVRNALADYVSKEEIVALISLPIGELRSLAIDRVVQHERVDKVEAGKMVDEMIEAHCKRKNPIRKLVKVKE